MSWVQNHYQTIKTMTIRHYFHSSFLVHFDPTSSLSLLVPISFLMFICSMLYHAHNKDNKDTIWLVMVHWTIYSQHWLLDCHMITWLPDCHQAWFSPFFFHPFFDPTSFTFLINLSSYVYFSYVSLFYASFILMTIWQEHNSIGIVPVYQLPTLAVRLPHDLLGYRLPKTVQFPFDHLILCWNLFSHPWLLPQLKVPDFPDTEWVGVRLPHEDLSWSQGSSSVPQQDLPDLKPPFDKPHPQILQGVRATLPPSTLFADRVLLHRGYSILIPNAWGGNCIPASRSYTRTGL